jgi:hypothetical protein
MVEVLDQVLLRAFEEAVNELADGCPAEAFAVEEGRINKGAPHLAPADAALADETLQQSHDSCISERTPFRKNLADFVNVALAQHPQNFQALEFKRRRDFAWRARASHTLVLLLQGVLQLCREG